VQRALIRALYNGVTLPNGHRHTSELAHAMIGAELGKRILKR
jgi:hypothetical protein